MFKVPADLGNEDGEKEEENEDLSRMLLMAVLMYEEILFGIGRGRELGTRREI